MIAIFYPIFTLTITVLACFTQKKTKLCGGFTPMTSPKHRPGPSGELTAPPDPQLQSTDVPIFFLHYPPEVLISLISDSTLPLFIWVRTNEFTIEAFK